MEYFLVRGQSADIGELKGGLFGADQKLGASMNAVVCGGAIYNLDDINDLEGTYYGSGFNVSRGYYGVSGKILFNDETDTELGSFGWAFGKSLDVGAQRITYTSLKSYLDPIRSYPTNLVRAIWFFSQNNPLTIDP